MTQPVDLLFIYSEIINLKLLFMKKLYTLCAALLALLPALTFAAQPEEVLRTVIVSDAAGPIIGASVVVKGTTTGSSTDIDGRTTISCADDAVLSISYIGYASLEVAVHARTQIEVRLEEDAQRLDEVVVVGYNTVRRAQMTGALSQVAGEKLEFQSSATLENRLQGQTPGVMIASGSGQPGSDDLTIRVRGTGSINGSNTPLYIMDGVMVESADFAALNTNDIADIQVLKDASATAIYGSRGANGVIVITTKSGQSGRTNINYRNQFGFSFLVDYLDMMNSEQNLQYQLQCVQSEPNSDFYPMMQILKREMEGTATEADLAKLASARSTDTDWMDLMTQTGFMQEHSVSISGGNDKTRFFISGSYLTQQGILKKSSLDRYSARFNIDHKATRWLDVGLKATVGYSTTSFSDPETGDNRQGWTNPWFTTLLAYPYESPDSWYNKDNPTLITKYYDNIAGRLKNVASTYVKASITDWLSVKSNFGLDFMYNRNTATLHRDHPEAQLNHGYYSETASELFRYTWTNTINVNKEFEGGHSLNAVAGMEMFQGRWYTSSFTGYDLNADMMESPAGIGDKTGASQYPPSIGGGRTMSNLLSFFMQASYSYKNRYNFSMSLRNDTSSKFYEKNASATFWSVGASWLISSEPWMQNIEWLNQLKLRASYGTTGNQDGVSDFGTFDGYSNSSYNGESGYAHSQLGNSELRWETSAQTNVGIDFGAFDSRFNLTLDFYNIKTKDLYMSKNISLTSGFGSILANAGSIVNRGIEIGVNTTPIRTQNFQWDLGFNYTYNKNKITDLGTWSNDEGRYINGYSIYELGRPIGTWYMAYYAGVSPENGMPVFYDDYGQLTTDINKAYMGSHYGSYEVPVFGGISTRLRYKGLQLDAQFTYAYDYTVMNCSRWYLDNHKFNGNKPTYMLNMWMKEGDVTNVPAFRDGIQPSPMASQFLEDASYLRLKTLRLSWTLPETWMRKTRFIRNLTIYAQGENLYTWTGYRGADPEVNGGYDIMAYPKPRTITFGLDMNF
jgi:TonB-linked SusC/RagA family outer membrane protein